MRWIFRRRLSPKLLSVVLTAVAAVAVGVAVAWIVVRATGARSQEPHPNVPDLSQRPLTPVAGPTALSTPRTPGECQSPENEQPAPGLPPLPCRNSELEPPAGSMPTPDPGERSDALERTHNVPEGWKKYDNPVFRYTFALPSGWYANMRPEGGQFSVLNPQELAWFEKGDPLPDAIVIVFEATTFDPATNPDRYNLAVADPNTTFGTYPGGIWEEPGNAEEGAARTILFAFLRDGVVFRGLANLGEADADAALVRQIFATITPY